MIDDHGHDGGVWQVATPAETPKEKNDEAAHEGFERKITRVAELELGPFFGLVLLIEDPVLRYHVGYLRLPAGHPWAGKGYDDIDAQVHGGLTFAGPPDEKRPGPEGSWWVGFDCCHFGDDYYRPDPAPPFDKVFGELRKKHPPRGIFRDVDFVRGELDSLAAQADLAANEGAL